LSSRLDAMQECGNGAGNADWPCMSRNIAMFSEVQAALHQLSILKVKETGADMLCLTWKKPVSRSCLR